MAYLTPVNLRGSGKRLWKCELCQKMTNDQGNMKRHMVLKHAKPSNEVCSNCLRVFANKYYLRSHLRTCMPSPIQPSTFTDRLKSILNEWILPLCSDKGECQGLCGENSIGISSVSPVRQGRQWSEQYQTSRDYLSRDALRWEVSTLQPQL